jgi:hypothetical protein
VWGACADIHAHPLRYDAQSLVACPVVQNGGRGVGARKQGRGGQIWGGNVRFKADVAVVERQGAPLMVHPSKSGGWVQGARGARGSADQRWMVLPRRSRGQTPRTTRGDNDPPQRANCVSRALACYVGTPVVAHRYFNTCPGHPSCAGA